MINQWICKDGVQVTNTVDRWEDALKLVAEPLLKSEAIEPKYIDSIIKEHHELGPYYVIYRG